MSGDEFYDDDVTSGVIEAEAAAEPPRCRYTFGKTDGTKCQAIESHPIHHGVDDGPDHAHEFQT
jgi:hypothetical protein